MEKSDFKSGSNETINILLQKLYEVDRGKSPLIELEFLGSFIEFMNENSNEITNDNYIEIYFDKWVNKFNNKESAYAILNLFTEFKPYSIDDIKFITFEKECEFSKDPKGRIFKLLSSAEFLTLQNGNSKGFLPTHEYITKIIRKYLASKEIPTGVKCHTEYYKKNCENASYKKRIERNYSRCHFTRAPMNAFFVIMIATIYIMFFLSNYEESKCLEYYIQRISTTLVAVPSIIYIYNYCDKILLAKGVMSALPTYLTSAAFVVVSYLYPNIWAVALGVEIFILALNILFAICTRVTKEARHIFLKDSLVFGSIGILVAAIGVVLFVYFNESTDTSLIFYILKYSYYVIFILYTIISDTAHIKSSYYNGRIGYLNMVKLK